MARACGCGVSVFECVVCVDELPRFSVWCRMISFVKKVAVMALLGVAQAFSTSGSDSYDNDMDDLLLQVVLCSFAVSRVLLVCAMVCIWVLGFCFVHDHERACVLFACVLCGPY